MVNDISVIEISPRANVIQQIATVDRFSVNNLYKKSKECTCSDTGRLLTNEKNALHRLEKHRCYNMYANPYEYILNKLHTAGYRGYSFFHKKPIEDLIQSGFQGQVPWGNTLF